MAGTHQKPSNDRIPISHPWIGRHSTSRLLTQDPNLPPEHITTTNQEVYGHPSHPIIFRIGNGGAGYTGLLRHLCEAFIAEQQPGEGDFRIGWVSNHSRHSQIALLADVVQVALTYEPENEQIATEEGWARRVCRVFNDHFILVGPEVGIPPGSSLGEVLRMIARSNGERLVGINDGKSVKFHSRGDGSATFAKEQVLWRTVGVEHDQRNWIETYPLVPYQALVKAEAEQAFLLTDRSTFLTAKRDGVVLSLRCQVEGGRELLNPCSVLVGTFPVEEGDGVGSPGRERAVKFAEWLAGDTSQDIVREYGRDWEAGKPLFTTGEKEEFDSEDRLDL